MSWRSEHIWIELITGSRKLSNFCWALIVFLGSLGFLLVGTSSFLGRNLISFVPSQQIIFFPQGIVMSFYGIAGLFISSYLLVVRYHMNRPEKTPVWLLRFLDKEKYDQHWFECIEKEFLFLYFLLLDSVHKSHNNCLKIHSELRWEFLLKK